MRRPVTALVLLALSACGSKDSPTDPNTNRVKSLTRVTSDVLQRQGRKVAISDLFIARDRNGALVADAKMYCTTPAYIALIADSLFAFVAGQETLGTLRCFASTVPLQPSTGFSPDPGPADSLTILAGVDLVAHLFTAHWSCGSPTVQWQGLGIVDSVQYSGRIAHVDYPGNAPFVPNHDPVAPLAWRGKRSFWRGGAIVSADADSIDAIYATVSRQAPDTLQLSSAAWGAGTEPMLRIARAPLHYLSRGWCPGTTAQFPYMTATDMQEVF